MVGEPDEAGPRPLTFLAAVGWTLTAQLLFVLVVQTAEALRPGASTDVVTLTAARLVAYALVFFGILRVHEPESSIRRTIALRPPKVLHAALGLVIGGLLSPGASWLNDVLTRRFPLSQEQIEATEHVFAADSASKRVLLVLAFGVVLPLGEELFFRGVLFTPLARRAREQTVVLATAVFDTFFLVATPAGAPAVLLTVVALGFLRARSGSIVPSALGRMAFYAVSLLPFARGRPEWEVPWQAAAVTATLALALLALFGRIRPVEGEVDTTGGTVR